MFTIIGKVVSFLFSAVWCTTYLNMFIEQHTVMIRITFIGQVSVHTRGQTNRTCMIQQKTKEKHRQRGAEAAIRTCN